MCTRSRMYMRTFPWHRAMDPAAHKQSLNPEQRTRSHGVSTRTHSAVNAACVNRPEETSV